jgi:hypothetical protein
MAVVAHTTAALRSPPKISTGSTVATAGRRPAPVRRDRSDASPSAATGRAVRRPDALDAVLARSVRERADRPALQRILGNRAVQALITPGAPTVQRMPSASGVKGAVGLGKKPSPAQKAGKLADKAGTAKVATTADLEKQLARLEAATRKLKAGHIKAGQKAIKAGDKASDKHDKPTQDAAFLVKVAGQRIFDQLDDPDQKSQASSGLAFAEQKKRLRRVIDENQLIYDEVRVEKTKREAGDIYVKSGRASGPGGQAGKGAFTHLTPDAKGWGYDELGPRPPVNAKSQAWMAEKGLTDYDDAVEKSETKYVKEWLLFRNMQPELYDYVKKKKRRDEAARLGLSPAEFAAILTFTTADFRYINPATANDPEFMVKSRPGSFANPLTMPKKKYLADRKKKFLDLQGEGSLHAGMAMQGLLKMPVFRGKLYRGESLSSKAFDDSFVRSANGDVKAKVTTFSRNTITSMTKDPNKPWTFMDGSDERVYWEMDVIDGRDIEKLSHADIEREVVVLPGAEFAITSVEAAVLHGKKYWLVKAKQTR